MTSKYYEPHVDLHIHSLDVVASSFQCKVTTENVLEAFGVYKLEDRKTQVREVLALRWIDFTGKPLLTVSVLKRYSR